MIEAKPLSSGNLAIIEDYSNKINNKYLTQYKPQTPEPSAITSTIKGWLPSIKSTGQFIGKKVSALESEKLANLSVETAVGYLIPKTEQSALGVLFAGSERGIIELAKKQITPKILPGIEYLITNAGGLTAVVAFEALKLVGSAIFTSKSDKPNFQAELITFRDGKAYIGETELDDVELKTALTNIIKYCIYEDLKKINRDQVSDYLSQDIFITNNCKLITSDGHVLNNEEVKTFEIAIKMLSRDNITRTRKEIKQAVNFLAEHRYNQFLNEKAIDESSRSSIEKNIDNRVIVSSENELFIKNQDGTATLTTKDAVDKLKKSAEEELQCTVNEFEALEVTPGTEEKPQSSWWNMFFGR